MGALLEGRRLRSNGRLQDLKGVLIEAETLAGGKACVYVTGSFARGEASTHSDVDLFIVGLVAPTANAEEYRVLSNLDEICLKAELIRAIRGLGLPEFSGDGEYLTHYTVGELVKTLGTSTDDARNTFTARLLLLLESKSLIGADVYSEVINQVIKAYWRDFSDHENDFRPSFLAPRRPPKLLHLRPGENPPPLML
jgi:predicted nucleotidyltransferase